MIELRQGHFASFFDVPFRIYQGKPFVSPMRSDLKAMVDFDRNPFFGNDRGTFFTAFQDGRPVGRLTAHIDDAANARFTESAGSFGFFDCIDDGTVAERLLRAAEDFVRARGCTSIRGNMNLTANQEIGVVVEHDERRPYLAQIWNPAYIPDLLASCGYVAEKSMTTFANPDVSTIDADTLLGDKHRALLDDPEYRFVAFDLRRFDEHVEGVRQVLNAAMDGNDLFVPMTEAQARFQLGPLKLVMDPSLFQIAWHRDQMVGCTMCVPDVVPLLQRARSRLWPFGWWTLLTGRRGLKSASAIIILVRPEYQNTGVMRVLSRAMVKALQDGGYRDLGGTWIGDDNEPSLRSVRALGLEPWHRVQLFARTL